MDAYLTLLRELKTNGILKADRTGVGTYSLFGYQMRFDLKQGFPLITTKAMHLKSIIHELLWFLKGDTNIRYLQENGVRIWNEWASDSGDLGPVYGKQWRAWPGPDGQLIDQIAAVCELLKTDPDSRRLVVSAWNPAVLPDPKLSPQENVARGRQALPPCHCLFQFYVAQGKLSCQLYQRSADVFLGVPFNIASYALLTLMLAQVSGLEPGDYVHTFGDVHLYTNHLAQAEEQLSREPFPLPTMSLNPSVTSIFEFNFNDFHLKNYQAHPHISAPVAV